MLQMTSLELNFLKGYCFFFSDSYNIDQHDYSVRLRAAQKFLQDGDKVVPIFFISCESSVPS